MFSLYKQDKKLTILVPKKTTKELLDELSSVTQMLPFSMLESYVRENYHAHSLYGLLQKLPGPNGEYELFLYKKATRSHHLSSTMSIKITVDDQDNMHLEKDCDLTKLVLLQIRGDGKQAAIDFNKSMMRKEMVSSVKKNPYNHDHFIYLSLIKPKLAKSCYDGFIKQLEQIKEQFSQGAEYTTNFFNLNDPDTLESDLEKQLKESKLDLTLKNKKIYIIIHAHCTAGSDALFGEYSQDKDTRQWSVNYDKVVLLLKKIKFPPDTVLDFDIYACEPGEFTKEKMAFCLKFRDEIRNHFKNVSVKGSLLINYSGPDLVLSESPRDVATFGVMREPISSKKQMVHSDVYMRIMHYPKEKDSKTAYNDLVLSLQAYAEDIVAKKELDFYDGVYDLLIKKWNDFVDFINYISQSIKIIDDYIATIKVGDKKSYEYLKQSFEADIEKYYKDTAVTLNFSESLMGFKQLYSDYFSELIAISNIHLLKSHLHSLPRNRLFTNKSKTRLLQIIEKAEEGSISFLAAWNFTFGQIHGEIQRSFSTLKLG